MSSNKTFLKNVITGNVDGLNCIVSFGKRISLCAAPSPPPPRTEVLLQS
uniref:Uncharacterized protein n=1 Tax=Anguilla anguilla TaxID=7936 RepID=A0A0E9WIL6_ANGAN